MNTELKFYIYSWVNYLFNLAHLITMYNTINHLYSSYTVMIALFKVLFSGYLHHLP